MSTDLAAFQALLDDWRTEIIYGCHEGNYYGSTERASSARARVEEAFREVERECDERKRQIDNVWKPGIDKAEQLIAAAERERDEARAERDALAHDLAAAVSRPLAMESAARADKAEARADRDAARAELREWVEADDDVGPLDDPHSPQGIRLRVAKERLRALARAADPGNKSDEEGA